ncbi:MAG: lactate utilization protein [Thermodesulfobacteriota bacterium]
MSAHFDFYWQKRFDAVQKALEKNKFLVHQVNDVQEAKHLVLETLLPETGGKSVSWGGSGTFRETGLYEALSQSDFEVVDTFDKSISLEEQLERRRQAMLVDVFFTSTNALTEHGVLVNLDMIGNRINGLTFGPRHVIVLIGRNKIVPDVEDGMERIKNYVAPLNAYKLGKKTPCAETGFCQDCDSPERICNTWTITEKSFPKGRVRIVLINQDLGL